MADDPARPPAPRPNPAAELPTGAAPVVTTLPPAMPPAMPADLPTGAAPIVNTQPPPMPADLPTGAAPVVTTQPPPMPADLPTGAAPVVTTQPPPMPADLPTGAAPVVTTQPPLMPAELPTSAAQIVPTRPPEMPTGAAQIVPTRPPEMPTGAAQVIATRPPEMPSTLPPAMPTISGPAISIVHSRPPEIPNSAVMPTMAGALESLPPGMPPARYQLGSEIARGGMGRVVEATDTRLGRVVAFKEALSKDTDTLRRFERETRITARLEHPSIVPVHDAGASGNGAPFYVMRKVSGRPLEKLVAAAETLGQRLALIPHIVDSAQAIAHAHERGIVHRDIKPSNILVGDLGETVVIDWGLAKVIGEADDPHTPRPLVDLDDTLKTRAGIVYGTPGFMAPEQLRGAPVNEQADVYALGATLYHLLSRTPPHHAKTADEMMKAAVAAPPTPIHQLVDGVPPDLATIVDKALARDPQRRYQDARELAMDLQRFLTGQLVASHHYSTREKIVRWVKRNRGMAAAIAALLVVGSLAIVRIIIERNRADANAEVAHREALEAERQRDLADARNEKLTLNQARDNINIDPTKSIAMMKPLAGKDWRDVRGIAAAARATGVAWSAPASKQTESLEMSRDGRRVLSAGHDGVIRIHDLSKRTTRTLAELRKPSFARFADDERQVVAWRDRALTVIDTRTGNQRGVIAERPIIDLEVVGITAYYVDDQHALWALDLATSAAVQLALDEPIRQVAPSPDGRWLALAGERHLLLFDRTATDKPAYEVSFGEVGTMAWSPAGDHVAVVIKDMQYYVIDVEIDDYPSIVHRQLTGERQFAAHTGSKMYSIGPTGLAVVSRTERDASLRKQIPGTAIGLAQARGNTMIAGGSMGITVVSPDGDRVLPLQARLDRVLASPASPYVVAQLENHLLVWNLDDIQPRRLTSMATGVAMFATADQIITGGTTNGPTLAIDVATGKSRALGNWPGLRAVTASRSGSVIALIDGQRQLHLLEAGKEPADLPGPVDFAGFSQDVLVTATLDGGVTAYDPATQKRTPLGVPRAPLIGLAWSKRHPWIAGAFADGSLWRKNLATGETATVKRALGLASPLPDSKLLVEADGSVVFLHASDVYAWAADGRQPRLAQLPKPPVDLGPAGDTAVTAFAEDGTVYTIGRQDPHAVDDSLPAVAGAVAMSADTGVFTLRDQGALVVFDPAVHLRWTLAPAGSVTFDNPQVSPDGRRVLAHSESGLLLWTIEQPQSAAATVAWLDALTNAVMDDRGPGGIGWR